MNSIISTQSIVNHLRQSVHFPRKQNRKYSGREYQRHAAVFSKKHVEDEEQCSASQPPDYLCTLHCLTDTSSSAELVELERALAKHTVDVVRAPFALTGDTRFYRSAAAAATDAQSISFFRVKPITFDLYLSLALAVYFLAFFPLVKEARSMAEVYKLYGFK